MALPLSLSLNISVHHLRGLLPPFDPAHFAASASYFRLLGALTAVTYTLLGDDPPLSRVSLRERARDFTTIPESSTPFEGLPFRASSRSRK